MTGNREKVLHGRILKLKGVVRICKKECEPPYLEIVGLQMQILKPHTTVMSTKCCEMISLSYSSSEAKKFKIL